MQEVRSGVGGDSRKAAHGLEKFSCRRTERIWRGAVWAARPSRRSFSRQPGSDMGVARGGETCMCEGQEKGRKVFGGGRGGEAESLREIVYVCVYFNGQLYSRQAVYLRFACKRKQPRYNLFRRGGTLRRR